MSRFYNTVNAALADQNSEDKAVTRDVLTVLRRDYQERYDVYLSGIGQLTYDDAIDEFLERDSQECRVLERRLATAVKNNALLKKLNKDRERLGVNNIAHNRPAQQRVVDAVHALGIRDTGVLARLKRFLRGN